MKWFLNLLLVVVAVPAFAVTMVNVDKDAYLAGPKVTAEDFEGKVILLEFFGHGCGPCVSAMPGTVALAKKYKKDDRFIAVASHLWSNDKTRIARFIERTGADELPVYQKLTIEGLPYPGGVPHAVVVGHDGNVVWQGHPAEHAAMKGAIDDALKAAPKVEKKAPTLKAELERRKQKAKERASTPSFKLKK